MPQPARPTGQLSPRLKTRLMLTSLAAGSWEDVCNCRCPWTFFGLIAKAEGQARASYKMHGPEAGFSSTAFAFSHSQASRLCTGGRIFPPQSCRYRGPKGFLPSSEALGVGCSLGWQCGPGYTSAPAGIQSRRVLARGSCTPPCTGPNAAAALEARKFYPLAWCRHGRGRLPSSVAGGLDRLSIF